MSTTTDRRYVCQLGHNEQINQVFLASDKQLRPNRNGNLYLQLQLSDRSGGDRRPAVERQRKRLPRVRKRRLCKGRRQHAALPGQHAAHRQRDPPRPARRSRRTRFPRPAVRRDRPHGDAAVRDAAHDQVARAPQPGRVLLDGHRVHGEVHHRPGRHEESPRLPRRAAGARRQLDGAGAASSRRATRGWIRTSCSSARSCTMRPRSTNSRTIATSPTPTKANSSATWSSR